MRQLQPVVAPPSHCLRTPPSSFPAVSSVLFCCEATGSWWRGLVPSRLSDLRSISWHSGMSGSRVPDGRSTWRQLEGSRFAARCHAFQSSTPPAPTLALQCSGGCKGPLDSSSLERPCTLPTSGKAPGTMRMLSLRGTWSCLASPHALVHLSHRAPLVLPPPQLDADAVDRGVRRIGRRRVVPPVGAGHACGAVQPAAPLRPL